MKKIVFLTGTRADYGKIKSLLKQVQSNSAMELYVYVTGMHMSELHGGTYREVQADGYQHIHLDETARESRSMSDALGHIISGFTRYVNAVKPDLIVVHGDRIEAMAGALTAVLNNVRLAHIEGGEISGTIDESLRHAISKLANDHFVANETAANYLCKLGENTDRIYVIGSPDIDCMLRSDLPSLEQVKNHYEIAFERFGIVLFHPTTTEVQDLRQQVKVLVDSLIKSEKCFVVIYPNNDLGHELILDEYKRLLAPSVSDRFRLIPSVRFESFLTLLKQTDVLIGNSSAGIRETCVYGVPSINIGTRQLGRCSMAAFENIQHCPFNEDVLLKALNNISCYRKQSDGWGKGDADLRFMQIIDQPLFWKNSLQKKLAYD